MFSSYMYTSYLVVRWLACCLGGKMFVIPVVVKPKTTIVARVVTNNLDGLDGLYLSVNCCFC